MAYTKGYPVWHDDPVHDTPILAEKLNNIEDGIEDAHGLIATLDGESDAAIAAANAARVAGDAAVQASVDAHKADAVDAHTAASISVPPSHVVGADDVDEALADLYAAIVGGGMPSTIIDAKGDLIVGAEDDLPTKLAVGADGEILIADAVAPFGLKWGEAPSGLPDPTGNEDEVLTVVGDVAVWAPVPPGLPDTTGEEGNWLTVEGGAAVWAPLETGGGVDYKGAWAAPTDYAQGDVVLYQGREYVAVNPSTGQTPVAATPTVGALPVIGMGIALPSSPFDGQEFILVDSLTAPTYSWRFRYVAAKASNKWVFIGGAPTFHEIGAAENTASGTYVALTTPGPTLTPPVGGEYLVAISCTAYMPTAAGAYMSFAIGAAAAIDSESTSSVIHGTRSSVLMREQKKGALAAGAALAARYKTDSGVSGTFSNRWMSLLPVAVGG